MCSEIRVLERNSGARIDTLVYDHMMAHIVFNTEMEASLPSSLPINQVGNGGSLKVFVNSKRVDFAYELVFGYALGCIGIKEYDCRVYLFEDADDLCVLKSLIFAIGEEFNAGLKIFLDDGRVIMSLGEKIIYETTIAL
ncbi:hypothetical protein M970_101150 [Encephalitozoon cuniculi EcunIII-L]|nr:hypothetical protein M970_101150 [Encephalitozoon cuniculi EcunIII-L]